jgi:hypothetical protein
MIELLAHAINKSTIQEHHFSVFQTGAFIFLTKMFCRISGSFSTTTYIGFLILISTSTDLI